MESKYTLMMALPPYDESPEAMRLTLAYSNAIEACTSAVIATGSVRLMREFKADLQVKQQAIIARGPGSACVANLSPEEMYVIMEACRAIANEGITS